MFEHFYSDKIKVRVVGMLSIIKTVEGPKAKHTGTEEAIAIIEVNSK